jgi:hypothetical protein
MRDVKKRLAKLEPPLRAVTDSQFESLSDAELERELSSARRELAKNKKAIEAELDNHGLDHPLRDELKQVLREIEVTLGEACTA